MLRLWLTSLFVLAGLVHAGPAAMEQAPLASIAQVLSLSNDEGADRHPFHLRGQVTLYQPAGYQLFIQDGSGGIYCVPPTGTIVEAGDWVEVEGFTARGGFAPILQWTSVKVIGHGPMPEPLRVGEAGQIAPESANLWAIAKGKILRTETRSRNGWKFFTLYMILQGRVPTQGRGGNGEELPCFRRGGCRC